MDLAASDYRKRRGVAQPGSVLAWGASGRPFKSARPDQFTTRRHTSLLDKLPRRSFFYA